MSENVKVGTAHMTAPSATMPKPTEAQGYLVAAQGMLEGAVPLGRGDPLPVFALTLLCGHACEAALKAILAKSGISAETLRKPPYSHDILYLWQAVDNVVKTLPTPQPDWVCQLDSVYDKPFHLKYPLGFHGIVLPNQRAMLEGSVSLVEIAASFVNA